MGETEGVSFLPSPAYDGFPGEFQEEVRRYGAASSPASGGTAEAKPPAFPPRRPTGQGRERGGVASHPVREAPLLVRKTSAGGGASKARVPRGGGAGLKTLRHIRET